MKILCAFESLGIGKALGQRIRVEGLVSGLESIGNEVTSFAFHPKKRPFAELLKFFFADFKNFNQLIADSKPDLVVVFGLPLAFALCWRLPRRAKNLRFHVDICDSWVLLSTVKRRLLLPSSEKLTRTLKLSLAKFALSSLPSNASYSHITKSDLAADSTFLRPKTGIVVPNGVGEERMWVESVCGNPDGPFLVLGDGAYPPNQEALQNAISWLSKNDRLRSIGLTIAGPNWTKINAEGLNFVGWVPDLKAVFSSTRGSLLLVTSGAGQKNKALDALAHGHPILGTAEARNGLEDFPLWVEFTQQAVDEAVTQLEEAKSEFLPFTLPTWPSISAGMLEKVKP